MLILRPVATNLISSDSYFRLQLFRGVEIGDVVPPLNNCDGRELQTGDLALCVVADALRKNLRPTDMLARFGGEEFIVMLPETAVKTALAIANRLRTATAERKIYDEALGDLPSVTISIGVAERQAGTSLDELITLADSALYDAKKAGRNRICHHSPE